MKKGFSIIELIFAIMIIAIITSIAAPKLLNFTSKATSTVLIQDIKTITSSIQNYYMINGSIEKITDCVSINQKYWEIADLQVENKENGNPCVTISIEENQLELVIDEDVGEICEAVAQSGIHSEVISLHQ